MRRITLDGLLARVRRTIRRESPGDGGGRLQWAGGCRKPEGVYPGPRSGPVTTDGGTLLVGL
ncbi:hypothetical protein OH799_06235 [Nocardia sp. NBC_00881]|uniref:hypothetical protein n=1 Tax=Nocardia sp. NBC_00881 TaxID=2975995 RepID=UPI003862E2DE|nr:hypothetical protein OH799_06235 [Nocardia sp. NBC_00881]